MFAMKKKIPNPQEMKELMSEMADQRAEEVRRLKDEEGLTFEEIGKRMNPPVSRQRAEQLYRRSKGR